MRSLPFGLDLRRFGDFDHYGDAPGGRKYAGCQARYVRVGGHLDGLAQGLAVDPQLLATTGDRQPSCRRSASMQKPVEAAIRGGEVRIEAIAVVCPYRLCRTILGSISTNEHPRVLPDEFCGAPCA